MSPSTKIVFILIYSQMNGTIPLEASAAQHKLADKNKAACLVGVDYTMLRTWCLHNKANVA